MQNPLEILNKYWGYSAFRPLQEEIIDAVLHKKDTLALLPTGGGKSICFQVPAMCLEGICIVVTPLIALMKDQVEQLQRREIKAIAIHAGMGKREIDHLLDNCVFGNYKFLYVSPERLKTDIFIERSKRMNIALLAIDEAHCISQWGYDFRPPYLEIGNFKKEIGIDRVIALTASATKEVKSDILEKLQLQNTEIFQKSFARPNLSYSVFNLENKERKLLEILQSVKGSAVVYVRNRKRTESYADFLKRKGVSAAFYHAGLSGAERSTRQDLWIKNRVRVMVATNAFGMGIDKPDVRVVIHLDIPDSLEAYYQEAGRGGRDEKKAYAVFLYNETDIVTFKERLNNSMVSPQQLKSTYQSLANFFQLAAGSIPSSSLAIDLKRFFSTYNLKPIVALNAMKKLEELGLIQLGEGVFELSRINIRLEKQELYKYQVANSQFDGLIKALLRLYGGDLFTSFVKIKEGDIAKMTKSSRKEIKQKLEHLQRLEILDYQQPKEGSNVLFLTPRQNADNLVFDEMLLNKRNQLVKDKGEEVLRYINAKKCKSLFLQNYFGEETDKECGICDNDLNQKKSLATNKLSSETVLLLLHSPKNFSQLRAALSQFNEKTIIDKLRLLMEEGKVRQEGNVFMKH